jgi:uncharacterized protein (TIGR02996 family)
MTTEDDFQSALDNNPEDWQTRLVFADWLQDRDDSRAEGYRTLGTLRRCPAGVGGEFCPWFVCAPDAHLGHDCYLPADWFDEVHFDGRNDIYLPSHALRPYGTRRAVEDAVALAFAKLPPDRRAELSAVRTGDPT